MEHVLELDPAVGGFVIIDDLFMVEPTRVLEICKGIQERGLDIVWNSEIRADLVDPEVLSAMHQAGCRQILIGVESGSPRMLELANKQITVEMIRRAAKAVHDAGMEVYSMCVIGLPTETVEDVDATERLLREIKVDYSEFGSYTPYPDTRLYPAALEAGFVPPAPWRSGEGWGRSTYSSRTRRAWWRSPANATGTWPAGPSAGQWCAPT